MIKLPVGVYVHIPFCARKCGYCDFYSVPADNALMEKYAEVLKQRFSLYAGETADTLYFGGGTPSLMGTRLAAITAAAKEIFSLNEAPPAARESLLGTFPSGSGLFPEPNNAEITMEANPAKDLARVFDCAAKAGVNRISIGLQSANEAELGSLSRLHSAADARAAVAAAKTAGIFNISLDILLGIPGQTMDSLKQTLDFCLSQDIAHLSAYILKLEENTPLFRRRPSLPSDDETAAFYLFVCESLEKNGFTQYEISNFAKPGFACRHNLKYWYCDAYLGFGPAAHGFYRGQRFFYPRSLSSYLRGDTPISDGIGGDFPEYAMLRLRLREGLSRSKTDMRFGSGFFQKCLQKTGAFMKAGLVEADNEKIRLTPRGFLVSNQVIASLLT